MKLDYLKCIREYLSETREHLGVGSFSISNQFDPKCIYGTVKGSVLITDVNSIYIINNFSSLDELFISLFNNNVARLCNTKYLIKDLSQYHSTLKSVSIGNVEDILTEEQRYFYEKLLHGDIQSFYDEKENVVLGFSDSAWAYVYVPTKSTKCR